MIEQEETKLEINVAFNNATITRKSCGSHDQRLQNLEDCHNLLVSACRKAALKAFDDRKSRDE